MAPDFTNLPTELRQEIIFLAILPTIPKTMTGLFDSPLTRRRGPRRAGETFRRKRMSSSQRTAGRLIKVSKMLKADTMCAIWRHERRLALLEQEIDELRREVRPGRAQALLQLQARYGGARALGLRPDYAKADHVAYDFFRLKYERRALEWVATPSAEERIWRWVLSTPGAFPGT